MSRIKNMLGNMSDKKKIFIVALAIAFAVATIPILKMPAPAEAGGPQQPYTVCGFVKYENNTPVKNALVRIVDVITGIEKTNYTNDAGYYSLYFKIDNETFDGDGLVGRAVDVTGNQSTNETTVDYNIVPRWLNFTIDTPITTKTLKGPMCQSGYYITLDTVFNFTAIDNLTGVNATYYRIWYDGQWHPTPGTGAGKNHNFYVYSGNFSSGDFAWAGEGKYYIEFYSDDLLGNKEYTHNQSHCVDETKPIYSIEFGCPTVNISYEGINYTMIKGCAPIWINASDAGACGSGVKWLNITGSYIGEWPGQTVEPLFEIHIKDNDDNDTNDEEGIISAVVHFYGDCFHELDIEIVDCIGNKAIYDRDIAVDATKPNITKEIGEPCYPGPYGNKTWLTNHTVIWLNASDDGCQGGAGAKMMGYTIWWKKNESSPDWNYTAYPPVVVKDNEAGDFDNRVGYISTKLTFKYGCYHLLKAWVIDYVGNNNTLAIKNKHYVDITPPSIRKDIEKITKLEQEEMNVGAIVNYTKDDWQSFKAPWSYIDAVSVHVCGYFDSAYETKVDVYDETRTKLLAHTEPFDLNGEYCGWIQLHLLNRLYVDEGETYWLCINTSQSPDFYWNASNENPYPDGYAIVNGIDNYSWDFAFKIEYYPIYPYFYPMEYTLFNETEQHDGLNGTWLTSEATLVLDSWDEGCMGGVGFKSLLYRIWFNGTWHPENDTDVYCGNDNIVYVDGKYWYVAKNETVMYNEIKFHEECKHIIQIRAEDLLGNVRIINQTHWVDNSPPEAEVEFPSTHGYYYDNATGKIFLRACKGFWINVTDKPECAVGVRDFILYWRYEYTNFTTPYMEKHPEDVNDTEYGVPVFINGEWWWKMEAPEFSAYLHFKEECMHKIFYFYEASDLLDNSVESEVENITIYVDANDLEVYKEHPEHGYLKDVYQEEIVIEETIFQDSFEDGDASDWTFYALEGNDIWVVNNTLPWWATLSFVDGSYFLLYDEHAWDAGMSTFNASSAVTPSINCSDYVNTRLSFAIDFENLTGSGELWVNVSNDNGNSWINVFYTKDSMDTLIDIDISSIADGKTILINFTYSDGDAWAEGACIDNVRVYGYKVSVVEHEKEYISCYARINLSAKDMPDEILVMNPYQDEGNQTDTLQTYGVDTAWPWDAQSFVAADDHINETRLYLQWFGDVNVTVYIHNDTTMEPSVALGSKTVHLNGTGEGWIKFTFEPGIEVKKGEVYYIEAHAEPASMCSWNFSGEDEYADGHSWISGEEREEFDWMFRILYYTANPCASGIEDIYYGYEYECMWHPANETDNPNGEEIVNISTYYDDNEIQSAFGGRYLWYKYDDSKGIKFTEECMHILYYWTKDNVCHHSKIYNQTYYVDNSPPEIEIEYPEHGYSPVYRLVEYVDLAFIVDTSGSMNDEWDILDSVMQGVINNISSKGVNLSVIIYGLDYNASSLPYGRGMYTVWYNGTNVSAHSEDWGPGTSWAALWHPWRDGTLKIVIPISDENAYNGEPETSEDLFSIQEAISLCQDNGVVVCPFYGDFPGYVNASSVLKEMWMLANGTGGTVSYFGNTTVFVDTLMSIIMEAATIERESLRCCAKVSLVAVDKPIGEIKIVDQQQIYGGEAYEIDATHFHNMQSFVPTVNKLDAVSLLLSATYDEVNVSIYDENFTLLGYAKATISSTTPTWYQFHFIPSIDLIPGLTYYIDVVSSYPEHYWWYSSDLYPYGHAFMNGEWEATKDFAFKTEYYGDSEIECAAGVEGIYWRYVYNNVSHPIDENDNVSLHGKVVDLSNYYPEPEIADYLWYEYNDSLGIHFYEECEHDLYFFAKDRVCHRSQVYHKKYYVDNSEPIVNKTHPDHGYDVVEGKEYLRKGANITICADDMPIGNCSSGTWLYYRFENETGKYPYYKFEGFEDTPADWTISSPWAINDIEAHSGNKSIGIYTSFTGASSLIWKNIVLPDIPRIELFFWHKVNNGEDDTAVNSLMAYVHGEGMVPLKYFSIFDDTLPQDWTQVQVNLSQFANKTIDLIWTYSNAYDKGEEWYIDDVEIIGWYGVYGWDNACVNISFNECWHKLYYFAKDPVCHSTEIYSQEYYVDGTPPETNHDVIKYGYRPPGIICIQDEIEITANNSGKEPCIYPYIETYYRWEWKDENGTWHYYPDASHPQAINGSEIAVSEHADKISPYYWLLYNGTFNFTEGCEHKLYYFSKDGLCNTEEPKEWGVGVDNEAPETKMEFEGIYYIVNEEAVYIRNDTIIWLNATDLPNYPNCTTGVNYTKYAIWKYNYSKPGWDMLVPWRSTNDATPDGIYVYWFGNGTSERRISIKIVLKELLESKGITGIKQCGKYEIHWYSVDYNPFIENEHDVDVIVDCTPPNSTKEFGEPVVEDYLYGEIIHWITSSTPIWINGTDNRIWDSGIWKVCIKYKRVDEVEFIQKCINGSSGVFYINGSDGKYRIFHWAVDNVRHASDYNLTKQHVILDNTPPSSRVADIIPWMKEETPFDITVINITDNGPFGGVGVCKVEVYYRYSPDNISWSPWMLYAVNESLITLPDGSIKNWTLAFEALNYSGYYQFISIAYDCLGNMEQPPYYYGDYDAWCYMKDIYEPNISKEYGEPCIEWEFEGEEVGHAITSSTPIYINVTDTPEEGDSGIDKIYWSFDGTTWYNTSSYGGAHIVSYILYLAGMPDGIYTIFIKATDMAGNNASHPKQKVLLDITPPISYVEPISPYIQSAPFEIIANASDEGVGVADVILYYRYSEDNVTWSNWTEYGSGTYDGMIGKWTWTFDATDEGYYQFYTIAIDNLGNEETAPAIADAECMITIYKSYDINMDGEVNVLDMIIIGQHFNYHPTPADPLIVRRADVNNDGVINVLDMILVGQHIGDP